MNQEDREIDRAIIKYEEREEIFVITAYPLKKAYRRHGHEG